MGHHWKTRWICLVAGLALVAPATTARAGTVEYRDFVILVDGKESGQSSLSITTQDDGMTVMSARASVVINKVILKIKYEIQATEWWKDGALVALKTQVNDNGKRFELQAGVDANQLRVRAGALDRIVRRDVWVNSYWKLADARFHNKPVPILEGDSGREINGFLQYIGEEKVTVGNQTLKCYRFRVTGGSSPVELWFDESHRLVRQEFEEQRAKVVLHLTGVRR